MYYFICEYCGRKAKRLSNKAKHRPRCRCKGGPGITYMTIHNKTTYNGWKRNKK